MVAAQGELKLTDGMLTGACERCTVPLTGSHRSPCDHHDVIDHMAIILPRLLCTEALEKSYSGASA